MNGAGGALRPWHTSDTRVLDQLSVTCTVVHDESTEILGGDAFSMRGAQREITGYLISQGYEPPGRWETQRFDANEDRSWPCAISRQRKRARSMVRNGLAGTVADA